MKKYLMKSVAAVAALAALNSCSHDFTTMTQAEIDKANYEAAFLNYVGGTISKDQDWGFGNSTRGITRSFATPEVAEIDVPYSDEWIEDYLETAKEPDSVNSSDNADNSHSVAGEAQSIGAAINNGMYAIYNNRGSFTGDDEEWNFLRTWLYPYYAAQYGWDWDGNTYTWSYYGTNVTTQEEAVAAIFRIFAESKYDWKDYFQGSAGTGETWVVDETYVRNFKITGTWNGDINVVGSEGYLPDHVTRSNAERTVVVANGGVWNLTQNQRVGEFGRIIIADGGTLNISSGVALELANQARLVVLDGGLIEGDGEIMVTNGNDEGLEGYNGGTINVHKVNNNFGKFYNYGIFKADIYAAGSQESNFYNHGLAVIGGSKETGSEGGSYYVSSNARVFNKCQFYCKGDLRLRNYEGVGGSALLVDGELMLSGSEDGTGDASYVGLAAGALVKTGTIYNNGTSWSGPTSGGYAVVTTGSFTYLNWAQDTMPLDYGYFENNIYVEAKDWTNTPGGNGMASGDQSTAEYKFWNIVANGYGANQEGTGTVARGNGHVTKITESTDDNDEIIPTDTFVKGESGCTPGYKGTPTDNPDPDPNPNPNPNPTPNPEVYDLRIIAEDLSASQASDFDFNDVVIDVKFGSPAKLKVVAAGGTLPLKIGADANNEGGVEVHDMFGVQVDQMVNTGMGPEKTAVVIEVDGNNQFTTVSGTVCTLHNMNINSAADAKNLRLIVYKNGNWEEMTAERAEPASKIAVSPSFTILRERASIKDAYPGFVDWVQNSSNNSWWDQITDTDEH